MNETAPISLPQVQRPRHLRRIVGRLVLLVLVPALTIAGAVVGWTFTGGTASTDDAYVKADKTTIVSRVSGRVTEVAVTENQSVKKGDLLFRVDPEPYRLALVHAEADLAAARLDIGSLRASYRAQLAQLKGAQDSADYWTREYERQRDLVGTHDVAVSKFEQVRNSMDTARLNADSLQQSVNATLQALDGDPNLPVDKHPKVMAAIATRDRAQLELGYTEIDAPMDAYIAQCDLHPGAWVQSGAPVFDVMSSAAPRVEANFKETDLTDVRTGQPAEVTVDTYPGQVFRGHVASIAPATGAEFSVLPAQNASGNWVKVVQRIDVRVAIDPEPGQPELRSGMSADVTIVTGRRHRVGDLAIMLASLFGAAPASATAAH